MLGISASVIYLLANRLLTKKPAHGWLVSIDVLGSLLRLVRLFRTHLDQLVGSNKDTFPFNRNDYSGIGLDS